MIIISENMYKILEIYIYENIQNYSLISVSLSGTGTVPSSGTLVVYYSNDGTDANILSTISVVVQDVNATGNGSTNSPAFNPSHTFVPTSKYFKIIYLIIYIIIYNNI